MYQKQYLSFLNKIIAIININVDNIVHKMEYFFPLQQRNRHIVLKIKLK